MHILERTLTSWTTNQRSWQNYHIL